MTRLAWLPSRRSLLVALATVVLMAVVTGGADAAWRLSKSAYYCVLRAKVQNSRGAPRAGKDPARQRQMRLLVVASQPHGTGTWGTKPARAVKRGSTRRKASSVLANPEKTGALASGCAVGYGTAGAQCVPRRAPGNRRLTCAYLVKQFPHGVSVVGHDRLHLDSNRDRIACGYGDRRN
jgi:hypothetical protein